MIPQEFQPKSPDHVVTIHVTEAEWFLPYLKHAEIPFELAESRIEPIGGFVWALEGGYGQLINLDVFVPEEYQEQFHQIFQDKFLSHFEEKEVSKE